MGAERIDANHQRVGRALPVTHRAVFASLPSANASREVVRRLRSAIGLGLLVDGERLPKEPDMARQLGVSIFSLREALQALRAEGLIATKPGKNGGSFVQPPEQTYTLIEQDMRGLSSADLRDLGDWRRMLASEAAGLAAQRGTDANLLRLTSSAQAVGAAESASAARRAYGRFQIEVAAAAQSTRLNRAELAMHDEFDWFLQAVLRHAEQRARCCAELMALTEAIRLQNAQRARSVAERHVLGLIEQISRERLQLLAAQQPSRSNDAFVSVTELVDTVKKFAHAVVAVVDDMAQEGARALTGPRRPLGRSIAKAARFHLESTAMPVTGIGVVAEVGVVPGAPYWMNWIERRPSGEIAAADHVLDPARDDFYDYQHREFLAYPRTHHEPWATGPYVDYNGVDDYVVTFSVPILYEGRFLGVAAADVLAGDLEHSLAPWLAGTTNLCLLVNRENRVLLSNSLIYSTGELIRSTAGLDTYEVGVFGWCVVTSVSANPNTSQEITLATSPQ